MSDDRRIKTRNVGMMTVEDIRHMVRWCDCQTESWWQTDVSYLTVGQTLALYHAANDAGYAGMDEWACDERDAALKAWNRISTPGTHTEG